MTKTEQTAAEGGGPEGEKIVADSKHLDFLQAAITRMAGNSFLVKGWSVTLTTALLGLAVANDLPELLLAGLFAILLFGVIDTYYLALEKGFRNRFDEAVKVYVGATDKPSFDMNPGFDGALFRKALKSPAILLVYPALLLTLLAAAILLCLCI